MQTKIKLEMGIDLICAVCSQPLGFDMQKGNVIAVFPCRRCAPKENIAPFLLGTPTKEDNYEKSA